MGQAGPPTARRVYIYGHFPEKKFTKDRPRRRVDDEHHFEGGSLATRKLDSANERVQREELWAASRVSEANIIIFQHCVVKWLPYCRFRRIVLTAVTMVLALCACFHPKFAWESLSILHIGPSQQQTSLLWSFWVEACVYLGHKRRRGHRLPRNGYARYSHLKSFSQRSELGH